MDDTTLWIIGSILLFFSALAVWLEYSSRKQLKKLEDEERKREADRQKQRDFKAARDKAIETDRARMIQRRWVDSLSGGTVNYQPQRKAPVVPITKPQESRRHNDPQVESSDNSTATAIALGLLAASYVGSRSSSDSDGYIRPEPMSGGGGSFDGGGSSGDWSSSSSDSSSSSSDCGSSSSSDSSSSCSSSD